ncbi:GATOR complex protein MIOS-B [Cimex lectularius]|uniref:WD repeat protein mio zinc-ribbon like domain-containing protein n=1 Tax=Cimex lectularius TaxID=79782 RepID=A0A8I6RAC8_CIMLE|nr:GATOR complex protein MIOS-B [Cimex lectularius]
MTSTRWEVLWSPVHKNKFIKWDTEISLYETLDQNDCDLKDDYVEISEYTVARLIAKNSNHHYMKCVDIYPKEEKDLLLAIGQANGKVVLTSFGPSQFDSLGLTGLELPPKYARQCNVVQWNKIENHLIAAGLDRYRSDHCILVWDLKTRHHNLVAELGLSDMAHSLCWLSEHPKSLIIGMNNKTLKMVDLRDTSRGANSSQTKAVYGVTVPPHPSYLVASYIENQIAIWDVRSFEKPVVTLQQGKPVTKILWSPTRSNLLGSLQRDSRSIHLHDVQQMEDMEPTILERSIKPLLNHIQITSFSWHPKDENRLLTINLSGSMTDYTIFERITLNWSQSCNLVWTHGQRMLKSVPVSDPSYSIFGDISSLMKKRAFQGYGLKNELKENANLVDDEQVQKIWHWLDHSKALIDGGVIPSPGGGANKHPGICSVLGLDNGNNSNARSELTFLSWSGVRTTASAKIYRSEMRDRALSLCNWKFIHEPMALQITIEELKEQGCVTKAASLAVFGLKLKQAIKILSESHNTVSMALSGFTDDKTSVWRESCIASRANLGDPYLRAIFAFLTSDSDNYELVVNEQGMDVEDRIGFALTFLSDNKLNEFITQLSDSLTSEGNLAGILLTGMCSQVLPLFQNYLDNSCDIQTVSVVVMRTLPPLLLEHERAQYWINCYRELLDMWRMWTQRAQFDIWYYSRSSTRPEQQVYVSCNFCGKSTYSIRNATKNKGQYPRSKLSCCANCRKPQPRCAICLMHMGTASTYQPEITNPPNLQLNPFDSWYCWCQACRHGGHVSHINQWFKEHQECPVTECNCKCFSLDALSNNFS